MFLLLSSLSGFYGEAAGFTPKGQTNEKSVLITHSPLVPSFCHVHLRPIWLYNHGFRELNLFLTVCADKLD